MDPRQSLPDLQLRDATPDDVPVILRFIRELADYERLAHEVVATEATLRKTLFGERPFAEVVLAENAGDLVGFALFFHNYSTFLSAPGLYLEDLYVQPRARGRGIGRALLRHLAGLACERGCGRFEWSVLDWNEPAIRFYERLGAKPQSDWTVYRVTGPALRELADAADT
jgi:GNAT superfamily N-acetyltransferase